MTIRPTTIRGHPCFELAIYRAGNRKRLYFDTMDEAEKARADAVKQQKAFGKAFDVLSAREKSDTMAILQEIKESGWTLPRVWKAFKANKATRGESVSKVVDLKKAFDDFLAEKQRQRLAAKSLVGYKSNVGMFVKGREKLPASSVTRAAVEEWLSNAKWSPRTFNTRRTSLHSFFKWCANKDLIHQIPTAKIQPISSKRMGDIDAAPTILDYWQCLTLLHTTLTQDPGLLPQVVLGMFAGLRPESEAQKAAKDHIHDDGLILVPGAHAKDRQRRYVKIHPQLAQWLEVIEQVGEWQPRNFRRRFERIREAAGLIRRVIKKKPRLKKKKGKLRNDFQYWSQIESTGWDQDCLRHTFASNYLAAFGAEKTIEALGHGDYTMLFGHYRALVKPADASKFWDGLGPDAVVSVNKFMRTQNPPCDKCGKHESMHVGHERLCCECYVLAGNPPADWHVVCMAVNERKRRLTQEEWNQAVNGTWLSSTPPPSRLRTIHP